MANRSYSSALELILLVSPNACTLNNLMSATSEVVSINEFRASTISIYKKLKLYPGFVKTLLRILPDRGKFFYVVLDLINKN